MKNKLTRLLALCLAFVFAMGGLVACGDDEGGDEQKTEAGTRDEAATKSEMDLALDELDDLDWGGKELTVLCSEMFKGESEYDADFDGSSSSSQVINDAVHERNSRMETLCNLKYNTIIKDDAALETLIRNEAQVPTGDFQLIDYRIGATANLAVGRYLYNYLDMGVDLDYSWWDSGTADFCMEDNIFFMTGDVNFGDDNVTYVLIFNKELQKRYSETVPNPYETVKNWEWTLSYFNDVIQGVSAENGDGKWDENDTYGFITTWEYGNTFFIGSDLRYISNSRDDDAPTLFLDEGKMEKALDVLQLSRDIYHANNASYMSPAGEEDKGLSAFKANRGLFYGEVASYLQKLNEEMDTDFGVLPVPKYDKAQEFYRTWTHGSGSCLSVTAAISADQAELVGNLVQAYAILSAQTVQPAFYDVMLSKRNVRDPESAEMLDIIFQNRIYEMSFYFTNNFSFFDLFKSSVNSETGGNFSSTYSSASRGFDRKMTSLLKSLRS